MWTTNSTDISVNGNLYNKYVHAHEKNTKSNALENVVCQKTMKLSCLQKKTTTKNNYFQSSRKDDWKEDVLIKNSVSFNLVTILQPLISLQSIASLCKNYRNFFPCLFVKFLSVSCSAQHGILLIYNKVQ